MAYIGGYYYESAQDKAKAKAETSFQAKVSANQAKQAAAAAKAIQDERDAAADARTQEMHDLEVARLAREAEIQRQQGIVGAEWAVQFLGEWNSSREELTGMVNTAFDDVDRAWENIESGKQWLSDLESNKELVGQEYQSFKEAYAPLEAEAMRTQMEGLGTQRGLMERIRGLSEADYEGVSGRAKADVGSESEKARRAEDRRLQGLGISPESGKSRAAMSGSFIDEALSKVLAANKARSMEKERVAGVAMGGLSVINPAQASGISSGIRSQGLDYLKEITNIGATGLAGATNLAQAGGGLAQTRGNIADIYGRNIVQPMGEAGMSLLGTAMAAGPENLAGQSGNIGLGGVAPAGPGAGDVNTGPYQPIDTSGLVSGGGGAVKKAPVAPGTGDINVGQPYTGDRSGLIENRTAGDVTGQPYYITGGLTA